MPRVAHRWTELPAPPAAAQAGGVHMLSLNGDLVLLGGRPLVTTVWRSRDGANTWTQVGSGGYSPAREDFAAATVTDPVSDAQARQWRW